LLHARGVRWAIIALAGLVASSLASGVGSSRRHKARVMAERVVHPGIAHGRQARPRMCASAPSIGLD